MTPFRTSVIARSAWTTQRWANGGGITHEIWRHRADDHGVDELESVHGFDLRLSVAEIDGSQPFSSFPGIHRTLIPLDDNALSLVIGPAPPPLCPDDAPAATHGLPMTKHHAIHFSGSVPAETRGSGRAMDFNVMSTLERRAHVEVSKAETHRFSPSIWAITRARNLAVFALQTMLSADGDAPIELEPFDTLVHLTSSSLESSEPISYRADVPVVWIRF